MDKRTVLLIEDERNIRELVEYNLARHGYSVRAVWDGATGLKAALQDTPLLIILDLMLPGMNGLDFCKTLRQNYKTRLVPLIILSAKNEEADVVLGLESGADDYLTKPFSPRQLMARIKALLRRCEPPSEERLIRLGPLEIDTARHLVFAAKKAVDLTSREFLLLKCFAESGGRVLSREAILNQVWGRDTALNVDDRAVDKHVGELRRKLESAGSWIVTVKNFGYRFTPEASEDSESA